VSGLADQAERLVELGVPALAGITVADLRRHVAALRDEGPSPVLVVHPGLVPASRLAGLLERSGKPGFVVVDMEDVDEFVPIDGLDVPSSPIYVVHDIDRGDDLLNWSPAEALPEITARGRRPLTVNEGISWLLQQPEQLEPGLCFMTIGSRKPKARGGMDARTPAIWISGGTGRDGKERKGAPKVGWCWHNNRHTWLGFATCKPA
jgi:hypothetical protein